VFRDVAASLSVVQLPIVLLFGRTYLLVTQRRIASAVLRRSAAWDGVSFERIYLVKEKKRKPGVFHFSFPSLPYSPHSPEMEQGTLPIWRYNTTLLR
jgi:hypothetical protein